MRILVSAKIVPANRVSRRLDPSTGLMERDAGVLSKLDLHAVEEALRMREKLDGGAEVELLTVAPVSGLVAVRDALAMGVDRATLVADDGIGGSDLLATSRLLAAAIERRQPDLVLFGPQGEESEGGVLPAAVAQRLGWPVLSQVEEVRPGVEVIATTRQSENGYESLSCETPCVLSVASSINMPRLPAVRKKLEARRKQVDIVDVEGLGLAGSVVGAAGSGTVVRSVGPPPERPDPIVLKGEEDLVPAIVSFLETKGLA